MRPFLSHGLTRPSTPLDGPAVLALLLALAGLSLYALMVARIGEPTIGQTVAEHPGLLLGGGLVGLLGFGLWGRDWTSSVWRAALAPVLGALVGLLILMSPVVTVTHMQFDRGATQSQLQNVVVIPGPARLTGKVVVSNAGIKQVTANDAETKVSSTAKGEGWMSVQMNTMPGTLLLWLAPVIAPLVGVALTSQQRRNADR